MLTLECVGEFLGLGANTHPFAYFCRHCLHLFLAPARLHRTTYARQAANLWHFNKMIWRQVAEEVAADYRLHIVNSMPLAVCRFARFLFCRRLREVARYGKERGPADLLRLAPARSLNLASSAKWY